MSPSNRKSFEQHLADYLLLMKAEIHRRHRRECIDLWRREYGESVANRAAKIVIQERGEEYLKWPK